MHYVIGDVHGCFDDMMALINRIEAKDSEAQFIFLGDFIDRGDKVWETLCWVMENITADGKYQTVRGNHEDMAIDFMNSYNKWYARNRAEGAIPFQSVPGYRYDFDMVLFDNVPATGKGNWHCPTDLAPFIDFFSSMSYNKLLEIETVWGKRVSFRIVHANYKYGDVTEEEQNDINIWDRNYEGNFESEEIIVHGHTPTIVTDYFEGDVHNSKPGMICYRKNMINIDGGCTFAEKFLQYPDMLCAICLENLEEIYPYTVEERFISNIRKSRSNRDPHEAARLYENTYLNLSSSYRKEILVKMGKED